MGEWKKNGTRGSVPSKWAKATKYVFFRVDDDDDLIQDEWMTKWMTFYFG